MPDRNPPLPDYEAFATSEKARDIALAAGQNQEAAQAEDFLEVFRSNRPWRE
jgi:hypothetical protein